MVDFFEMYAYIDASFSRNRVRMMKVSATTVTGLVVGLATGLFGTLGSQLGVRLDWVGLIQRDAWWIVVLSMIVPLVDYLRGMRTSVVGSLTGHPFHQIAGFFTGLAVGLGLFLLYIAKFL
jgi:predicted small integral membrane protein